MASAKDRRPIGVEMGLKKAVQWIEESRRADPKASLAKLIDEASRRFELSPVQADFLYRYFTSPP